MTPGIFHRRFGWPLFWGSVALALLAGFILGGCFGCAATATVKEAPAEPVAASQPSATINSPQTDTKQAGNGVNSNVAGNTGFAYTSELSIGVVCLLGLTMAMQQWLSHRREMARIAKNGHGVTK